MGPTPPVSAAVDVDVAIAVRPGLRDLVAIANVLPADAAVTYTWERDGEPTTETADRIAAGSLAPGQTWTVHVSAVADGATATASDTVTVPEPPGGNVLFILLDDVGKEQIGAYGLNPDAPPTPNIDAFAAQGVRFNAAYSSPMCSSTRAEILTGRYARRTGMGDYIITEISYDILSEEALLLPEVIANAPTSYDTAMVGKWHLAGRLAPVPANHAIRSGFARFSGTLGNIGDYYAWLRIHNFQELPSYTYATVATTDDALDTIETVTEPFYVQLSYHAAHDPWHYPPSELHSQVIAKKPTYPQYYKAMVESVDREIGRLLASIDPEVLARTTVIVAGDNGTNSFATENGTPGKGTTYEAGVNVPLLMAGPTVTAPGTVCDALVHFTDLYATVADIAGAALTDLPDGNLGAYTADGAVRPIDGRSLLPYLADPARPSERAQVYSERFGPNGPPPYTLVKRMLRDDRYKVMDNQGVPFFFEFVPGVPGEGPNLLLGALTDEQQAAYDRLWGELIALSEGLEYEGF